jgi:two-component system LytT family response regulator
MRKLRCLIIDDKPLAVDILADYVDKIPFLALAGTATDPIIGLQLIREQQVDLVFLDIQMPQLTGLQLMKIAGPQCKFILTTAYAEYALDGYEHDVIDYLLKPISLDRFYRAAEKAMHLLASPAIALPVAAPTPAPEYLFVKTEHRIQKINLNDIRYIEAVQNYVSIHMPSARIMTLQTLKKIAEQIPSGPFIRVHRSYIVNLRHIDSVERGRIFIGDAIIPVGDNYRDEFYGVIDKG